VEFDRFSIDPHIARFDCAQLEDVVNQVLHPCGAFSNDGKKTIAGLGIFDGPGFKGLNECENRRQRSPQLMRNVGEKFLAHLFQPLDARDIDKNAECSVGRAGS
jgi:hypothetical protein